MKNSKYIKGAMLYSTLAATVLLFANCDDNKSNNNDRNDNMNQQDSRIVTEDRNDNNFNNNREGDDSEFLVKAAEMNLEEIQLAKLAQQKGTAAHVKELGKMMEDAHTKSLNELKGLAQSKNISIPSSETNDAKDAYKDLNDESGNDFDEAYIDKMVTKHEDAIDSFEDAAEDSDDQEIKRWAANSLPDLRKHLDRAKESQKKNENMQSKIN